jgi:ferredoxin-NADP reductase
MSSHTIASIDAETEVVVERKETAAEGVVALTLRAVSGEPLPAWEPGAHIDVLLPGGGARQYSLCGDPDDRSTYRIAVLREPESRGGSSWLCEELAESDRVTVRGPRSHFPLVEAPGYLFIAGGIGVTPMLPMAAEAEASGATWRMLYGGRQRASMAFLDELARYGDKVVIAPQDECGLLDLPGWLATPSPDTKIYCCGPEPLLAAVEAQCASWPHGALHVERFAPKEVGEPVRSEAFEVTLQQSGLTLTVPPDKSILEVVGEAGVSVLSACGEGTCGTCETAVVEGVPDHRDSLLDDDEKASGDYMMICISRSVTPRLVLDL